MIWPNSPTLASSCACRWTLCQRHNTSRLSNGIPIIEGELRTREGVTQVGVPTETSFLDMLEITAPGVTSATIADTVYPNGLIPGQSATILLDGINPADLFSFDTTLPAGSGANMWRRLRMDQSRQRRFPHTLR